MTETEAIHAYFGLSYANYLVVPRVVLQSMPDEWQVQFVALLEEMTSLLGTEWEPKAGYRVHVLDESKRYCTDPYSNYERGGRRLPTKNARRQ
jgi:hypothetical protein